jgi:hypothetical protein
VLSVCQACVKVCGTKYFGTARYAPRLSFALSSLSLKFTAAPSPAPSLQVWGGGGGCRVNVLWCVRVCGSDREKGKRRGEVGLGGRRERERTIQDRGYQELRCMAGGLIHGVCVRNNVNCLYIHRSAAISQPQPQPQPQPPPFLLLSSSLPRTPHPTLRTSWSTAWIVSLNQRLFGTFVCELMLLFSNGASQTA